MSGIAQERVPARIAVIGGAGAGKTTLARELAALRGSPFVELDALFWGPGWAASPRAEFRARVAAALSGAAWVADGNYSAARDLIWGRADTLVWLDYPLPLLLWRIVGRSLRRVAAAEELWHGNRETWRNQFFSRDSLLIDTRVTTGAAAPPSAPPSPTRPAPTWPSSASPRPAPPPISWPDNASSPAAAPITVVNFLLTTCGILRAIHR